MKATESSVFVLVHGAWRGGWCYARVAEVLRSRGHRVFTPTLTGLGERSHLAGRFPITFATHVDDIVNVFHWEDLRNVVLCGHSYGGIVITAVADKLAERIRALVYLDALIPQADKSLLEVSRSDELVAGLLKAAAAAGGQIIPPLPAAMFDTNAAAVEQVDRLCTPHPLASFCEPVTLAGAWRGVPRKTYVRATGWSGYEPLGFQPHLDIADDDQWTRIDVPCGHEIMIDAPEALADILVSAG